jgi:hypothetical protein
MIHLSSLDANDRMIAWSASQSHQLLDTKWRVKIRRTLLQSLIAPTILSTIDAPGVKSLSAMHPMQGKNI